MRQAGRYLPEFREIRKLNPNFVDLCLNEKLSSEITIQPIKRFDLDAAIIFSDILMIPYGLNQKVEFIKNFGPKLEDLVLEKILKVNKSEFIKKLLPVYKSIKNVKNNKILNDKNLIGFIGAPWTLLVYMLNKQSPKKSISKDFFKNKNLINSLLEKVEEFSKIHIENQIENGADVIQIFDSWVGLLEEKDLDKFCYAPTLNLVNFVKSKNIPVICFPRGIKDYKKYCDLIKPDGINIDYEVNPLKIKNEIQDITIQGGLDPKILLQDKDTLKKETLKYLDIFKDHPYIFNLGHGVLPDTDPKMVEYLIKFVRDY